MKATTIDSDALFAILATFDNAPESVTIISTEEIGNGEFITAKLTYDGTEATIPMVHYNGDEFVFTPLDWQGYLPQTVDSIADIRWRVNDTTDEATILNGLPRLF